MFANGELHTNAPCNCPSAIAVVGADTNDTGRL
jgi:hypothetical protein